MSGEYQITSTSKNTAKVEDIVLREKGTTRKVARFEIVENQENPEACVKVTIVHQRKSLSDSWKDDKSPGLNSLKAGESAKMPLSCSATLELFKAGADVYRIYSKMGVPWGTAKQIAVAPMEEIVRVDGDRAKLIRQLLEQGYSEEVWQELGATDPDLATRLSFARIQNLRADSLVTFREMLDGDLTENEWQDFFATNTWIFGYGLKFVFMRTLVAQPSYGGTNVTGSGGSRGDFLCGVASHGYGTTVLVEIKKATTALLAQKYRNSAYPLSPEVNGAISQLQANARRWEIEGARAEGNVELLSELTVAPRAILVVGHSAELDTAEKRRAFNLHRIHLTNPDILTFDELYNRAKFIIDGDPVQKRQKLSEWASDPTKSF